MNAVIKYPGAKWSIADWIIERLPPHARYVEPYFGSGAVLFNKAPAPYEEYDLSETSTDDPVEQARRFLTHAWQSFGRGIPGVKTGWKTKSPPYALRRWAQLPDELQAVAERLRGVQIERRPALDIIARHAQADTLIYADPPYPRALRRRFYPHEMTDAEHIALLDALNEHPGPVALSGFHCVMYDDRLRHWQAFERRMRVEGGQARTEVLWVNRTMNNMFPEIAS
jgi:DNA adenine methylase